MKIHMLDLDPRQYIEPDKYQKDFGSFAAISRGFNQGLKEIGCYADVNDADWIGICDGLNTSFNGYNKKRFLINVWDMVNVLPEELILSVKANSDIKLLGLSNSVTNLWRQYGVKCETVMPGCDTSVWQQTKPKNEQPTIIFNSFSNVRSGLDLFLEILAIYGDQFSNCKIIIKNTSESIKLASLIYDISKIKKLNLHYINNRISINELKNLYSESHVSLHVMRHSSWGLGIHESAACGCVPIVGDFQPSNEIVYPNIGTSIPVKRAININNIIPKLLDLGFTNCYGNFKYQTEPMFYDFDISVYARTIIETLLNFNTYNSQNYNKMINDNWSWSKSAKRLVEVLKNA